MSFFNDLNEKFKDKFLIASGSPEYFFMKNSYRLKRVCKLILDLFNESHIFSGSHNDVIIKQLELEFEMDRQIISSWEHGQEVDYFREGHAYIASTTFDMLASGRFHRYFGMLNYTGEYILKVYKNSLNYALRTHEIDKQTYEAELSKLHRAIHNAG